MEVSRSNFRATLPAIDKAIQDADFIAIDGEFTGLNSGKVLHAFDTPEDRYHKVREGAMEFLLMQFGICTFQYNKEKNNYQTKAFNFYIFPRPFGRQCPDVKFFCQSSSIDFLANVGFDFNKLFRNGIPYLAHSDEHRLREQLEQRHQQISSPSIDPDDSNRNITVPDEHKAFIKDVCDKVSDLLKSARQSLELEPCNAFIRKLIYQNVKTKFKSGIHIDTKKKDSRERYIVITKADEDKMKEMEAAKKNSEMDELDDAVGFSKVIRLLSKSEKLIVGHNMFLDICHILHQFHSPLPSDYEEFKSLSKYVFPRLLDTKLMASMQPLRELINSTTLGELHALLEKSPFVKPDIVPSEGFTGYKTTTEQLHEAGYDAFVTGICFVTMADYLGSLQKSEKRLLPGSPLLEPFVNKLFLMRVQDIPYINLDGDDLIPSRSHVFYVKFPKEWKTSDLCQLFLPFGSVYVAWVDDTSAFISLNNKDQANVVMKTLTQSDTYHVQTYEQYASLKKPAKTSSWMIDSEDTSNWALKKRSLSNDESGIASKRRKRSSEESDPEAADEEETSEEVLPTNKKKGKKPDPRRRCGKASKRKKKNGPSGTASHKAFEEDDVWE